MTRAAALLVTLALAFAALANGPAPVTTIILVRHAEKAAEPAADPPLTDAGQQRARELARVLGSANVSAIYTTTFARTRQTGAPLAEALKLEPVAIQPGPTFPADMAAKLLAGHAGKTVLVVGHSNTTQNVMKALGITDAPKIEETEFDNLFIVTLAEGHTPRMTALRYGAVAR